MIFSSLTYVLFLAIVILLYWRLPIRFRVPLILLASYTFYMSWHPPDGLIYGPVIFADSLYFYYLSRAMVRWPQFKKPILIIGVTTELCLLGYFKYINFLSQTLDALLAFCHLPAPHAHFDVFMPLAISFTNFVLISYLVDIYRGDEKPDPSFVRFASYVAFFPHLIAGPIVRAKELLHQFDSAPIFDHKRFVEGIHRFANGFFIKVFIADILAIYVDNIYGHPHLQAFNTSWVAGYAFSVQLFCDFFGYTLMAQGSALMLGYILPENFDAPYFSRNMSEFWKRWHISLSRWLKDYLYIPLGGNRQGKLKTYRNLFITMALGGLWHGANWTFVFWGLLQGLMLCLYKTGRYLNLNRWIPELLAVLITFHGVVIARVFFRAQTIGDAYHILLTMLNPWVNLNLNRQTWNIDTGLTFMSTETVLGVILLYFVGHWLIRKYRFSLKSLVLREMAIASAYSFLLYCLVTLGGSQSQQFIYFQF